MSGAGCRETYMHTSIVANENGSREHIVDGKVIESSNLMDLGKSSPESAVAQLVREALNLGASDVFFSAGANHVMVQMRHLGIVRPLGVLPVEHGRKCLAHVKAKAEMDTSERRRPQDGRWIFEPDEPGIDHGVDLRISSIPTLHGEDLAVRIVPHQQQ